ncbi:MAG: damage repair protein [Bacilli bacterium]
MNTIAVIDLKAFYAAVECVERKLDYFTTPLVVCDTSRGMGTIVLSVTPYCKSLGIPSRCRRRDIPHIKGMIYAVPRMALYVEKSCQVMDIILNYISEEDLHVYSIDECFVNLTPYLGYYNKTGEEIVDMIQKDIKAKLGLTATAGISFNPFMAKICLDNEGKNKVPYFRATWGKEDIENKLWKIEHVTDIWGIASGYGKRLSKIGIETVKDLATAPVSVLRDNFGIMGQQLHDLANGIDESNLREKYIPETTSFSTGQALFRDYTKTEVVTLLREMTDNLCVRLHNSNLVTDVIYVAVMYTFKAKKAGFSHQSKLVLPIDDNDLLFDNILQMYNKYIDDLPIRNVYISFGHLIKRNKVQLSLFENNEQLEENRNKQIVIEKVQQKYGKDKLYRATALLDESTFIERSKQIGGHKK